MTAPSTPPSTPPATPPGTRPPSKRAPVAHHPAEAARYAAGIYGSIVAAALIEALRAEHVSAELIALSLAATAGVVWLAHAWSGIVGDRIEHGPRIQIDRVIIVARTEWALVESSFLPLLLLLAGWAGAYSNGTAAKLALAACLGQLFVWGVIVGRRAYRHRWGAVLGGLTNALLGLALVELEAAVLH